MVDECFVCRGLIVFHVRNSSVPLVDQTLRLSAEQFLLHPVILHLVAVLHLLVVNSTQHLVSFARSICSFKVLLLAFELDCFVELLIVALSVEFLLDLLGLHVTLVSLRLPLDDSTPFVQIPLRVRGIVPFLVVVQILDLLLFLLHRLLYACRVHFQRVHDCIAAHCAIFIML